MTAWALATSGANAAVIAATGERRTCHVVDPRA